MTIWQKKKSENFFTFQKWNFTYFDPLISLEAKRMHESFQIFQPNMFVLILFFADKVFFTTFWFL